jgi:dihydrofolate reductase
VANLIYSMITSVDAYVADEQGNFDWAEPSEEVHAFVNDCERGIGTSLYGRRMYEMMTYWETDHPEFEGSAVSRDYAQIWRAAEKVVYSSTLAAASTTRTRIERPFDPEAVREMKAAASSDISVSGPHLAAQALKAGLVDEVQLFVVPHIVGGGNAVFPRGVRMKLELRDEHRFANGTVFTRYRFQR